MTAKKPKKRNPQDATRRNVQAANKRLAALEKHMRDVRVLIARLKFALEDFMGATRK